MNLSVPKSDDSDSSSKRREFRQKFSRLLRHRNKLDREKKEGEAMEENQQPEASDATTSLAFECTNMQTQSSLFGLLPGEIRNEIFAYALMCSEDEEAAYKEDSYWYRPGFQAPHKATSALLRTCKLAYIEGQKVFLAESEWSFWFG